MKKTLTLISIACTATIFAGCTYHKSSDLPPGQYEQSSKSVDADGTSRKENSTTDVYYDKDGNKKVTVDTKTTTDPKGLFNKKTTQTHRSVQ
jgi:hypothetical protein